MMKTMLARLGAWCLRKAGRYTLDIPADVAEAARAVVAGIQAENAQMSPEWKRHQAWQMLGRVKPDAAGRDIAAAIEWAVRQ